MYETLLKHHKGILLEFCPSLGAQLLSMIKRSLGFLCTTFPILVLIPLNIVWKYLFCCNFIMQLSNSFQFKHSIIHRLTTTWILGRGRLSILLCIYIYIFTNSMGLESDNVRICLYKIVRHLRSGLIFYFFSSIDVDYETSWHVDLKFSFCIIRVGVTMKSMFKRESKVNSL